MSKFLHNPIVHGVVSVLLFAVPLIVAQGGSWQELTIGGVLNGLYVWLVKANQA